MCVRTYVCITYVRMYVRMYVRTYVRTHARTYARMYVYICVCVCVHTLVCEHDCMQGSSEEGTIAYERVLVSR